jgi:hypothetical protein
MPNYPSKPFGITKCHSTINVNSLRKSEVELFENDIMEAYVTASKFGKQVKIQEFLNQSE